MTSWRARWIAWLGRRVGRWLIEAAYYPELAAWAMQAWTDGIITDDEMLRRLKKAHNV